MFSLSAVTRKLAMASCLCEYSGAFSGRFSKIRLDIYMYNCMFVSALPDPTCNSEKSANGVIKQILLLLLLLLLMVMLLKL